nr:YLP motif-containing protein 1-like [Nerophis lumbriciformis]
MYPSWGNYGAPPPQNFPGPGQRKMPGGGHAGPPSSFGCMQAPSSGSMFSNLQEQHLQQMQQLQMLHQKQLQNVLHHGSGMGPPSGYSAPAWQSAETAPMDRGAGMQAHIQGDTIANKPDHSQPPVPTQQHKIEPQPAPPPPDPAKDAMGMEAVGKDENSSLPNLSIFTQDQQQLWYQQHLQNLQKLKQERAKQNQKEGEPPNSQGAQPPPPPPSEPPAGAPPPPPPKEDQPAPPPPPEVSFTSMPYSPRSPDSKQDPEEADRLQKLQAAAAQWQQVQQQRVSLHYQALMQQHEKLQQILEKYQPLIQQPPNLQAMTPEMQLRHYQRQKQQFIPLLQEWEVTFKMWFEQFQTYPHKDQLHDYENQWKQWQTQMNATNDHLQETISALTAIVPYASMQYNNPGMGQYGSYPVQDMSVPPPPIAQPPVTQSQMAQLPPPLPVVAGGPTSQGPPPGPQTGPPPGKPHTPASVPPPTGGPPTEIGPTCPMNVPPPNFNSMGGPRGNNPRFNQPMRFDGPPRFDHRFEAPPQFQPPQHGFNGSPQFNQPGSRFNGPPRFDQPPQRFGEPPPFNQPGSRFDGPPRFDQPHQRFDGPSKFEQQAPKPGRQSRFDQPPKQTGPQPPTEGSPVPPPKQQGPQPQVKQDPKQPTSVDSSLKSVELPQSDQVKSQTPTSKTISEKEKLADSLKNAQSTNDDDTMDICNSPQSADSKPAQPAATPVESNEKDKSQNYPKPNGPSKNNNNLSSTQQEEHPPTQFQSRPEPVGPPYGRGRGHPLGFMPGRGRGHGQFGHGEFSGHNTGPSGGETEEMSNEFMPPEEELYEQQDEAYYWQDPSYEEFGAEGYEEPNEEIWMPEDNHYEVGEEYYEDSVEEPPVGGPPMGRGGPPMGRGGPPMGRGGPPMGRGGPPMGRGGPPMGRGGPPMGRGGPPMGRGGPPMGRGGPPMGRGGPPMGRGGPPMGRGGPPMGRGGPPMGRGGPPMGRGGPPMGRGGPPMGRGEPMDGQWEETGPPEYYEEEEPYWGEDGPPMRGMRPPFPSGRGRPPRGHPGFMRGRGIPPHLRHGPMEEEAFAYGMDHGNMDMEEDDNYMYQGDDPHNFMHPGAGRGRRPPPPPHEIMDLDADQFYHKEMEREHDWEPPYGRRPPMPHEFIERGDEMRSGPMGRGMARGAMHPGMPHEQEEGYRYRFVEDYGHGENAYGHKEDDYERRPPHPNDPRREDRFFDPEWDRGRSPPDREYPPPPEHYRDERWAEERERGPPHPIDEYDRRRGEIRERDYEPPPRQEDLARPPNWDHPSRFDSPTERMYPPYQDRRDEPPLDRPPLQNEPSSNQSENSAEQQGGNVLSLSQRQHEIILKAAQELKRMREQQEVKPGSASQHAAGDTLPELPASLLGLEIPIEVRNALKGMAASAQTPKTPSWDTNPAAPVTPVIPKTVDYAHGHEPGTTVERIAYGERIVLRPDPDRGYEKEPLREPYSRDPFYDRRPDPYMDRREYSREREFYREKPPQDFERDRYGRERYAPRERDDSSLMMVEERHALRPGFREREREFRERDRSNSREREDPFGRPGYDRPHYERPGMERGGPDRYGPTVPPFDRRGYPEDRGGPPTGPPLATPPQPLPQPLPPVEKKPEIKNVDDILKPPGRMSRPERIVVIMRGLPGSGKSHVAKLIRDKEVDCGGAPPRVLVLDDYFMTEVEKVEKDPDTGRRVKRKVLEYEFEPELEGTYRNSMLKTFKKTLDDGFFPFIILDTINDRVSHFEQFWSAAKTKGFEVYIAEITADTHTCAKRNSHARTLKDIMKMSNNWESTPRHMVRLDVRALLQDAAIEEVEMEDFNPEEEPKEAKREEEEEGDLGYIPKSKWEMDTSEAKLDKLDGLGSGSKRKRDGDHMAGLEDYLQLPDDYATRKSQPGKKRVRWADLEEQKDADRKRAIGFVVGQTDWEKITDDSGLLAQKALNRTKYF